MNQLPCSSAVAVSASARTSAAQPRVVGQLRMREGLEREQRDAEPDEARDLEQSRRRRSPIASSAERSHGRERGDGHMTPVERRLDGQPLGRVEHGEGGGVEEQHGRERDRDEPDRAAPALRRPRRRARRTRGIACRPRRRRPVAGEQSEPERARRDREERRHAREVVGVAIEEHVERGLQASV